MRRDFGRMSDVLRGAGAVLQAGAGSRHLADELAVYVADFRRVDGLSRYPLFSHHAS